MDGAGELRSAIERILRSMFPALMAPRGPVLARVTSVHTGGGAMSALEPRYSADVQILDAGGNVDATWPEIPDVELPVLWAGPGRGVYCVPTAGAVVRVGFEYGDYSRPYIETITGRGYAAPVHEQGKFIVAGNGAVIEISADGDVTIRGAGSVDVVGASVSVAAQAGACSVEGAMIQLGGVAALKPVMLMGPMGPEPSAKIMGM